jgi:hypothetical protein
MLEQFIKEHSPFKKFLLNGEIIDTRPYVGRETEGKKGTFTGIQFGVFGATPIFNEPEKPKREVIAYLDVAFHEAGAETVITEKNWREVLAQLPVDTTIFADEWTESRHYVATLRFTKKPNGTWVEDVVATAVPPATPVAPDGMASKATGQGKFSHHQPRL